MEKEVIIASTTGAVIAKDNKFSVIKNNRVLLATNNKDYAIQEYYRLCMQ